MENIGPNLDTAETLNVGQACMLIIVDDDNDYSQPLRRLKMLKIRPIKPVQSSAL